MDIGTIAVIGAGTMGRGIAYAALSSGYRTILEDILPERLADAQEEIRRGFDGEVAGDREAVR